MNIQTITYASPAQDLLRVVTDDGTLDVPWPCQTWHREAIEAWLADGGEIAAYKVPAVDLLAYLAEKRWQAEIGGTTWNGWNLPTDERSQAKYVAERLAVEDGSRIDGSPWKFPHGFEALTNAEVIDMARAARAHVLACFEREAQVAAQIEVGTITTTAEIDAVEWP